MMPISTSTSVLFRKFVVVMGWKIGAQAEVPMDKLVTAKVGEMDEIVTVVIRGMVCGVIKTLSQALG